MPKKVEFDSFAFQANFFYKTIGLESYHRAHGKRQSYLWDLMFIVFIVNMNLVLLSEVIYVILALKNRQNFVEATMNLSYAGFVFVGDIKIWSIWLKKDKLTELMSDLLDLYPVNGKLQEVYGVKRFLRRYNLISFGFVIIHLILIWSYNLFAMTSYLIYDYWLQVRVVERALPYYCWVPWDWSDHWSYYFMYASQNLAGHTCMSGQLASDLLLCVSATQVIMHYQYLSKEIEAHVVEWNKTKDGIEGDMEFLKYVIDYHQKILHLSESMNEVFGVSLLVNFMSSSFIMCFLGFQMTVDVNTDSLVMLFMFLFCSLVQVYMISNYGQELILASESIGHAVYKHDWQNANLQYKKMLVLIIRRAQKPAILKATSFLNISLGTMADLMQLSYKFFALLRTMYSK